MDTESKRIIFIEDWEITQIFRSGVDDSEGKILSYLYGNNSARGSSLLNAELSFNILYNQLCHLHEGVLKYAKEAIETTDRCRHDEILNVGDNDKCFTINNIDAAKLKLSAEACLLSTLTSADCIVDYTIDYSKKLFQKSIGGLFGEFRDMESRNKKGDSDYKKCMGRIYKTEMGCGIDDIIKIIRWRDCRVHQAHLYLYLSFDDNGYFVLYATSDNPFYRRSDRDFFFDSRELDKNILALRKYLQWWCRKTKKYIDDCS